MWVAGCTQLLLLAVCMDVRLLFHPFLVELFTLAVIILSTFDVLVKNFQLSLKELFIAKNFELIMEEVHR